MNYIAQPVEIIVKSPIGNIVKVDQLTLGSDRTFSTTMKASGSLWSAAGVYTVMAYFGATDTAQTTFQFAGSSATPPTQAPTTMPVDNTQLSVQYSITNGKVTDIKADVQSKSIIVSIQSTGDGVLTITLPRALIDSQNGGQDTQWVVLNDGQQSTYTETTTPTARTLTIPFAYGTSEIEIIGTQIIPEFGPIAVSSTCNCNHINNCSFSKDWTKIYAKILEPSTFSFFNYFDFKFCSSSNTSRQNNRFSTQLNFHKTDKYMKMKTNLVNKRLGGFVLLAIMSSAVGIGPVFASPFAVQNANLTNTNATSENLVSTAPISAISVTTDKTSYNDGDTVKVSGNTMNYIDQPVTLIIKSPIGNIVKVDQLTLGSDRTYSASYKATGSLWSAAGVYTIMVQYGSNANTAQTTFQFAGSSTSTQGPTMPVDGTSLSVQYSITNGKVTDIKANVLSKSIIVSMNSTGDGVLTITLPRALIDSQNGGQDTQWVVLNDGQQSTYTETTTPTARTLTIPFTYGTSEIEIIGTQIIPEFGPIAALVLAIAIISIIAVSAKTGLRFMPKY